MRAHYFLPLAMLGSIPATAAQGEVTTASLTLPSGVEITIVEAPVTGSYHPNCRRNGRPVQFEDYKPRTYVKKITGKYLGQTFTLDSSCMSDAWNGRPLEVPGVIRYFGGSCRILSDGLYCALRGIFADGAESFGAEWYLNKGRSIRTVLSGSKDVISLFQSQIDPPEYE